MRSVLLLLILSCVLHLRPVAQTELTDKTKVVFARNLRTYDGKKVDSLVCDIFYPTGAMSDQKYPVYFQYHAGNFTGGNRTNVTDYCDAMADNGFIVVAPDYRTGYPGASLFCATGDDSTNLQEAIYRAMQDVNACIRYITNHAELYNVDTNWVFIGGNSAGGTLALNDAYVNDSLAAIYYPNSVAKWGTLQSSGNDEPYHYRVKGVNAMWGGMPYWDSLISSKSAIPTILFKGGKDTNLPDGIGYYKGCTSRSKIRAGAGIYNVLTALQTPGVYHYHNNAGHTAYDDAFCIENSSCFFRALINGTPYSGYYEYYKRSCR